MSTATRSISQTENLVARQISHAVDALRVANARWRQRRAYQADVDQTIHELSNFTDRELADIGVCRLSINEIAREHAARKHGVTL